MVGDSRPDSIHFSVKLLYHNTTPTPTTSSRPLTLALPGCPELCPLSSWLELTASLRPEDWEAECETGAETSYVILLPSLLIVLLLFVFLLRWVGGCSSQLYHCPPLTHIPGQQGDTRSGGENISDSD